MYAKIFTQIYDSSIVENPEVRFTFMDLLVLADLNGVVDMTHEAISRRTNRPIEIIRSTILELEGPDKRSRTPDAEGRRIARLDDHRDWGWMILNYDRFRSIASEEQKREKTLVRVRRHRSKTRKSESVTHPVTQCNAPVTHANAGNAMQKQREKQMPEAYSEAEGVSAPANFAEIPSWKEFWGYCQTQSCLLPAEWYARDKWEAANSSHWRDKANWQAYARRCKAWWESDGRPMSPTKSKSYETDQRNSANRDGKSATPIQGSTKVGGF